MVYKIEDKASAALQKPSRMKTALPQVIAVTVKNILLLAFGLTLGFPTILIPGLLDGNDVFHFDNNGISWIGSINSICVPVGCLISGVISQALGRRRAMQIVNIPFVIAWLLFRFANTEWQIFLALAMTGLTGGFLEAPVLTYVAEIAQPNLRGMLSATSSVAVLLGVLIMFCMGTVFHWKTIALISCTFNVLSFFFLFFVPESPHWLISKNRLLDARKSLAWLRGWTTLEEIEAEYKQIYSEVREVPDEGIENPAFDGNMNGTITVAPSTISLPSATKKVPKRRKVPLMKLFTMKSFLWPFTLVAFVFFLGHFGGMTTFQIYAVQIFVSLRTPINKYYATVIMGLVELLGTIICTVLVHYIGKRVLTFISIFSLGICFAGAATYAYLIDVKSLITVHNANETVSNVTMTDSGLSEFTWIPMTFLISAAFVAHMGIRVLPWILTGEVFSNETRAAGSGFCSATSYILSFTANKSFFKMIEWLTLPGVFWFNSSVSFIGCLILYFVLPETEGKTLGQINEHFRGGKHMGKHVERKKRNDTNPGIVMNAFE